MTRPTVPAVSAEAQAARGWPRPGTRVRVTRTHTSGLVETTEGMAADGGWDEDRTTYWLMLNEGAGEVALTSDDVWTVTWEELEPAPSPVLPPIPEPGPYLDNTGHVVEIGKLGVRWAGELDWNFWDHVQPYGPFTRLRPVSEVVDRADAQELVLAARTGTTAAHPYGCGAGPDETCRDNDCDAWRALLARVDALGVTA